MKSLVTGPAAAYVVSVVALIGCVVLGALGKAIPAELWQLAAVGLGVGAGATVPTRYVETSASPGPAGVQ